MFTIFQVPVLHMISLNLIVIMQVGKSVFNLRIKVMKFRAVTFPWMHRWSKRVLAFKFTYIFLSYHIAYK